MAYQIKYNNFSLKGFTPSLSRGFSLIELLIVIGIFALLFSVSTSVYNSFRSHSNLEIAVSSVVEALRFSQSSAQSGKGDSKWGVEIPTSQITIFKGNSYASRDIPFDESFVFAGGISASGLGEVIFEKLTGITSTVGTIILTNGNESKNIVINEKGTITY